MHYKNGREAKNGDRVVMIDPYSKQIRSGMLHSAVAGNDKCNGRIAPVSDSDHYATLSECLHLDDFLTLLNAPAVVAPPVADLSQVVESTEPAKDAAHTDADAAEHIPSAEKA